ncbi:MAG: hypothetical protein GQF41_3175 [Candidatus Rifleibacterium amylolyticum]|nr:MAG: hypothetical protein GQF41_3175 [Candidatus Rifleibacterium amylolyticum]
MSPKFSRKVGFCSENADGTLAIAINQKNFDEVCYQELNDYLKVVFDVKPIVTAFVAARENFADFMASAGNCLSIMKKMNSPSSEAINKSLDCLSLLTRHVSNFLATASLFLANSEVQLGKVFGESSEEINLWNDYRRTLHLNSFAYRFIYELRNFSQHYGLPISGLNFQIDNMAKISRSIDLTIYVCKKDLLTDNFNWKRLKKEIEALEERTDLIPLLSEYNEILGKLFQKYIELFADKLLVCSKYINTFRATFKIPEGVQPVLFINEKGDNQSVPGRTELIPFDQFDWVHNKCNDF